MSCEEVATLSCEEGSLLGLEKESDVDQIPTAQLRKPRVLLMIIGAAAVLLCYVAGNSPLQVARMRAVVGLAIKPPFSDPGIKLENPEEYYDFGEELYRDPFSITKVVTKKDTGDQYLAEIFVFEDKDTAAYAERVYQLESKTLAGVKGVPEVIEAYMVQHNLIIVSSYVETKTALEWMAAKTPITEGGVAKLMVSIIQVLKGFHDKGQVHANINPWSVRVSESGDIFFTSLASVKKSGDVIDHIGDTEYASPEGLSFEPLLPASDVWSLAILADTLLTGVSPFYMGDEDKMIDEITKARFPYKSLADAGVSEKAQLAIKASTKRAPELRLSLDKYLESWQACESEDTELDIKSQLLDTNTRLLDEKSEEAISPCGPFKTFDEDMEFCEEEEEEDRRLAQ